MSGSPHNIAVNALSRTDRFTLFVYAKLRKKSEYSGVPDRQARLIINGAKKKSQVFCYLLQ